MIKLKGLLKPAQLLEQNRKHFEAETEKLRKAHEKGDAELIQKAADNIASCFQAAFSLYVAIPEPERNAIMSNKAIMEHLRNMGLDVKGLRKVLNGKGSKSA